VIFAVTCREKTQVRAKAQSAPGGNKNRRRKRRYPTNAPIAPISFHVARTPSRPCRQKFEGSPAAARTNPGPAEGWPIRAFTQGTGHIGASAAPYFKKAMTIPRQVSGPIVISRGKQPDLKV